MTNNSRIASQYAEIVCAAFPKREFTLLELGGGCGKFAFLFLGEMARRGIKNFRYLLTDGADKNVAYWKRHPMLAPWIEQGLLQTVRFDPFSDEKISADFVIANYFFDSIPCDLFRVEKGGICKGIVTLKGVGGWDDPGLLAKIRMTYAFRPLVGPPYPDFPEAGEVIDECRSLPEGSTFLFPIGAMQCLKRWASGEFHFLASDRAAGVEKKKEAFLPSLHGSACSFPVHFDLLRRFVERRGGSGAILSPSPEFTVALFSNEPTAAGTCFANQVFGPLRTETAGFSEVLLRLQEANWDATLFFSFFDWIERAFGQAPEEQKKGMLTGMREIGERFFPMFREEEILLERLAHFFRDLGEREEAERLHELAARCRELPEKTIGVELFLDAAQSLGEVLQIGDWDGAFEAIASRKPRRHAQIPWGSSLEGLGKFDTLFLFPPEFVQEPKKPSFVCEIEKQFSLNEKVYSDEEIEGFFALLYGEVDRKRVLHFFGELERKKNISREQLEKIGSRLEMEIPDREGDRFFETLMECVKGHMREGAVLRGFLPGIQRYEDPRFYEEIVVDPFLETKEKKEPRGLWVTVRKV